jgi:predicted P-loop ATPase
MVQREATNQASSAVAWMCPFHPVRDYLESLTWDGIERLDTWPSVYLGSDYIPITAQFGTRFLIAAVARIFEPGCKVDTTLILEGGQGKKKSSALEILAGQWFTDEIPDIRKKDGAMQLEGIWILEFAELEALEGPTADSSKKFLSRKVDRYRPVWGTHPMDFPRGCVFVGTTNKHQYLKDDTGNRRYWPIRTGEINLELLREDRDQLWAEAVVRYLAHNRYDVLGSSRWWFDPSIEPELVACAEFEQSERYMSDPWDRKIESWLKSRAASPGEDYPSTTVNDILRSCLQKEVADWTHQDQVRVSRALRLAKWTRYYASPNDERRREWRYRPIGAHGQVKVAGG